MLIKAHPRIKYEDVRVVKEAGLRSAVVIRVGSTPTPRTVPRDNFRVINSVVEYQVSNLLTWVRFPNDASARKSKV